MADERGGGRMTVSMLSASLLLIGAVVSGLFMLDDRYDQRDDISQLSERIQATSKKLVGIHDDFKVAIDRIIAQNYQIQVNNVNEEIAFYKDKADSVELKPYERRQLRRLQSEVEEFKKKWPNIAASFGLLGSNEID